MRAWAAGLCLALAACAAPQTEALRARPGGIPSAADIPRAPFYPQRTKECGPQALAMALSASGLKIAPDALVKEVFTPAREGSLTTGLVTAARRRGRLAYEVAGMAELFREVAAGRPVIVLQNLSLPVVPQWHYALVVGYDLDAGTVTLHSGATPRLTTAMATFERTWARGDHWALLVLPPGEMPARPDRRRYLEATVGLERARRFAEAHAAYGAAARQWPDDLSVHMGLGNSLYRLGRLAESAEAFERITRAYPRAADAFNNLAQVRFEMGELRAAERLARKAVALGGPNLGIYRQTLASITERAPTKTPER